jgi:transposase
MTAETRSPMTSVSEPTLYVAFELGATAWTLAMTSGVGLAPWVCTVRAGELGTVAARVRQGRVRCGVPATARVLSCYEAGRDGFWIHRALEAQGLRNRVVDSASIEVNRRARRAKTDRLDAVKLVRMLVRACSGERGVWREVHVPSAAAEAARHVSRERTQLVAEQTRIINQLRSWVALYGSTLPPRRVGAWWVALRDWAGAALPADVQSRLARAHTRLALIAEQLAAIGRTQAEALRAVPAAQRLVQLKGIATTGASVLLDEGLVWRAFRNRREVGGLLGFTPMPYQSGAQARDQGIDRAGNSRLRAVSIQLAWGWVRWQPSSALTQWYQHRFGSRGGRARRIGIVALARKLLIALWRCACQGRVPEGAVLKAA